MSLLAGDVTADPLAEAGRAAGPAARGRPGAAGPLGDRPGAVAGAGGGGGAVPRRGEPRGRAGGSAGRQAALVNPSTAFGLALCDELARCGLREVVVAPGSSGTPLAMAFAELEQRGRLRLHVRIDERSASFTALGLAKASRPAGGGGVHVRDGGGQLPPGRDRGRRVRGPAAGADRRPAARAARHRRQPGRSTRSSCTAARCAGTPRPGVPERLPGMAAYWRSLACRAWAHAAGGAGGLPGPVHLNLPLRDPLTPELPGTPAAPGLARVAGRPPGRAPWTRFEAPGRRPSRSSCPGPNAASSCAATATTTRRRSSGWPSRPGWPVLAEPSSGARQRAERPARLPVPARHPGVRGRPPPRRAGVGRPPGAFPPPVGLAGRLRRTSRGHRPGPGTLG